MLRRALLLGVLFAAPQACGPGGEVFLEWPALSSETQGLLVAVARPGSVEVELVEATDSARFAARQVGASRDEIRVVVIETPRSARDLGVAYGPLTAGSPEVCFARPMPSDGKAHEYDATRETWSVLDALPPRIDAFRFVSDCPCREFVFDRRYTIIEDREPSSIGAAISGDTWFGFARNYNARLDLTKTSTPTLLPRSYTTWDRIYFDAWVDEAGAVWAAAYSGVFRWDLESSPVPVVQEPETGCIGDRSCVEGAHSRGVGSDLETFVARRNGHVDRVTANGRETIFSGPLLGRDSNQGGDVAFLEDGRVFFLVHDDVAIGRYDGGRVDVRAGEGGEGRLVATPMGLVVGNRYSAVGLLDPDTLEVTRLRGLGDDGTVGRGLVRAVAAYGEGAIVASESGEFAHVVPDLGVCPPQQTTGFSEIRDVDVHGEEIVFTGTGRRRAHIVEVWRPME